MAQTKAVGMSCAQPHMAGAEWVCVCVPVLARGTPALPPASSTALLGPLPYPDPC